jgi:hypothetical protein
MYPDISPILLQAAEDKKWKKLGRKFQTHKEKLLRVAHALGTQEPMSADAERQLVKRIMETTESHMDATPRDAKTSSNAWVSFRPQEIFGSLFPNNRDRSTEAQEDLPDSSTMTNAQFLASLTTLVDRHPILASVAEEVMELVYDALQRAIEQRQNTVFKEIQNIQEKDCKRQMDFKAARAREIALEKIHGEFLAAVQNTFVTENDRQVGFFDPCATLFNHFYRQLTTIHGVEAVKAYHWGMLRYHLTFSRCSLLFRTVKFPGSQYGSNKDGPANTVQDRRTCFNGVGYAHNAA